MMKKVAAGLLASLLCVHSLSALAGPHGHDRYWRGDRHGPKVKVIHHHHRHGSPVAWGLAGLALGGVLYAAAQPVIAAPVVVVPPPRPPGQMWYYCDSYRAYYPNVPYCPEGWRAIPAY